MKELPKRDGWLYRLIRNELSKRYEVSEGDGITALDADLYIQDEGVAVMIRNCLMHGHEVGTSKNCILSYLTPGPLSDWVDQIKVADEEVERRLSEQGWRQLVVWQCAIKGRNRMSKEELTSAVLGFCESGELRREILGRDSGGEKTGKGGEKLDGLSPRLH